MPIDLRGGEDAKTKLLAQWGSLNTKVDRAAIGEDEFAWLENFFPVANGNLRTLYAEGSTVFTTANPRTIVSLYPYNLGAVAYVALFLDDGSALQIQASNGAQTTIGAAGTFYAGGANLPACSQYQSKYLIIGSDVSANAYWVWDGAHLFGAGTLSPQVTLAAGGQAYTSAPTLTATGGSGTGATFSTTVANSQVTDAVCTNGGSGYLLGEKVTLSFSGGGSDTEAQAKAVVSTIASGVGAVTVTNPGSGYTSAPTVAFSGGLPTPTNATVTPPTVSGGVVQNNAVVTVGGACYYTAPTVTLTGSGGTGSGATATATVNNGAALVSITVTNGGTGYTAPITVTLSNVTIPRAAVAIASINSLGAVISITVTDPGLGYILQPTINITGGGGSGATAIAQTVRGQIVSATILNGGTNYTAVPTVTFSSPDDPTATIPITASGAATLLSNVVSSITMANNGCGYLQANVDLRGGNRCAHAEAVLMPFGIKATAIETYQNQVWTTVDTKMSFTGPNSVGDFSTFNGGGSAPATDSFLRRALIGLKQNSGYLYRFADSSVNAITNVQTSTSGVTSYNNSNVDAQMGTAWRDTICAFDRAIVFANSTGVYALFGGSVNKVSDQLDGLFEKASFNTGQSGVIPTAAVMTIFGIRCYALLFTTTDPYSGTLRTLMACWDGKKWFCATQTKTLKQVALQEIDSVFTGWGTDGTRLFKLFQTPSTSLTKVYQTRLDGAAEPDTPWRTDNVYLVATLLNGSTASLVVSVDSERGVGVAQTYPLAAGRNIDGLASTPNGATFGVLRGFTGTTTAADLEVISMERMEFPYSKDQ